MRCSEKYSIDSILESVFQSIYRIGPVLCIVKFLWHMPITLLAYAINLTIIKMKVRHSTEIGGECCAETEKMQKSMSDANDKRVPSDRRYSL